MSQQDRKPNTTYTPILNWLRAKEEAGRFLAQVGQLEVIARAGPLPVYLRKATPEDIVVGNIIWYKHGDEGPFWMQIGRVLCPNDDFKAYVSHDGCRYGLDDAWVEIMPTLLIHILHQGRSLCRYYLDPPLLWPQNVRWVGIADVEKTQSLLVDGQQICDVCLHMMQDVYKEDKS